MIRSLDIDKLGATDKKWKINVALRKTNQRLLKNADFPLLSKIILKEKSLTLIPPPKKLQTNDYDIKEMSSPNKIQLVRIPQKPSKVYDWINNVHHVFHPPNIELESHSTYRDNYYNTIRGKPKAFNRNMGYFNYFNEQTRREREMNQLYTRKNLSKFSDKIRMNSRSDRKEPWPKLKNTLKRPVDANTRYSKGTNWMDNSTNSLRQSKDNYSNKLDVMQTRRASNQVENQERRKIKI